MGNILKNQVIRCSCGEYIEYAAGHDIWCINCEKTIRHNTKKSTKAPRIKKPRENNIKPAPQNKDIFSTIIEGIQIAVCVLAIMVWNVVWFVAQVVWYISLELIKVVGCLLLLLGLLLIGTGIALWVFSLI